jgi:aspartyl-tRNA(Asn)/glutamyl-tRNA(Gln) amidotransferase subunit A
MAETLQTIRTLQTALANATESPSSLAERALAHSNQNQSHNTYLWQDAEWTRAEAVRAEAMPRTTRSPLWGLPVSVKDCFDLAGAPTSIGTKFYRDLHGVASRDSWVVEQLRAAGAVITGKTHLHALAWGITGENPDFGDCLQPRDPTALTGGSSSGAAASVQEGSAAFAIGTDTGGSIRVPAALCGLAGYRASFGFGDWRGGAHLSESFDTIGCLFADLEGAPLFAHLFAPNQPSSITPFTKVAVISNTYLHDCEPAIAASMDTCIRELQSLGLDVTTIEVPWWEEAPEIFAPIQASEASHLHAGHFDRFEPVIRQRMEWGAHLETAAIAALRQRHHSFRTRMEELFATHELIILPAAPISRLASGADHTQSRSRLLRYTTPFSLSGSPVVTIPCAAGGMQLAASPQLDQPLLELAAQLASRRKSNASHPNA